MRRPPPAAARKLVIALWRYLEEGEIPEGAELCDWRAKVNGKRRVRARAEAVPA